MATPRLPVVTTIAIFLLAIAGPPGLGGAVVHAQKFFPDDPLTAEPPPLPVVNPQPRALSELFELFNNTINRPGERHPRAGVIAAGGVNTLGEVMDSDWFVNRHATRRLTREELVRGPGTDHAPDPGGPWRVLTVRPRGIRPGIVVADARDRLYLLMFDPPDHPELATGSQMVSSRIAHAIGYFVPECYLVSVDQSRLAITEQSAIVSSAGNRRALTPSDLDIFFRGVARRGPASYRAVAIYLSQEEWRAYLGPFQLFTRRSDDPNDVVVHEHRRDLRGLFVMSAWLNHASMRAVATADMLAEEDGIPRVRHFLVDFVDSLGSGRDEVKLAWEGNGPLLDGGSLFRNALGLGIWSPAWMREQFPGLPAVGRFASSTFDPERWSPVERLAAFENRLPDDEYWGAKQVAAFTDADLAAIVSTGGYTDPAAAAWITNTLIARRDRVARTYFDKVLPLDAFRVDGGVLRFDDLAVRHAVAEGSPTYAARWFRFDNASSTLTRIEGEDSFAVPREAIAAAGGSYYAARLESSGRSPESHVTVYLRTRSGGHDVVGIERGWPGKVIVNPRDLDPDVPRFRDLTPAQRRLYEPFATRDAAARGRTMTPEEHFESQTISVRTTFDSVTHSLQNSKLTDESGRELATALDLVTRIDRIAGQYQGRGGDLQFRLFTELRPDTVEILQKSTEFFRDRDNTVFHVGYPISFRQGGSVPNIQFSISEDGRRADLDIDYRSSGIPQGLFNGHLSASNSDVRAGDNFDRHTRRWAGFVDWWRAIFGTAPDERTSSATIEATGATEVPSRLPPDRPRGVSPADPQDAAQEFLTDWLVRHQLDEALDAVSPDLFACVNIDDDRQNEAIARERARGILRDTMRFVTDEMDRVRDLTEAIAAVQAGVSLPVALPHAFEREFTLKRLTPEQAAAEFLVCGRDARPPTGAVYYTTLFRFRREGSAVLGLLWSQEAGRWKLQSYRTFEM
jgi:hypothetical protein